MTKAALRSTVAASSLLALIAVAPPVAAQQNGGAAASVEFSLGEAGPLWGEINPFWGEIGAFWGEINPFWGEINPFWGEINPFYGEISPFWGEIGPFWGEINPFWGEISPFWGEINPFYGEINPFWGEIGPFWGEIGPFWGEINAFWGEIGPFEDGDDSAEDYAELAAQMRELFDQAALVWDAQIQAETGGDFYSVIGDPIAQRYGFDLNDPASFADLTAGDRSAFFLELYDALMSFSGADAVDHWMATINWSPALTQDSGAGGDVRIGLLDFSVVGGSGLDDNIAREGGFTNLSNGHGTAVASLMFAPHDGEGVMGIAPNATVFSYNPFDDTGTASWEDVRSGILALSNNPNTRPSIFNASLGVSGWTLPQEWADIISDKQVQNKTKDSLFVVAAGNDGVAQTSDIEWTKSATNDRLIVVGSVDPTGHISEFSNRPGEACLLVKGVCHENNKLKYRFMVAPGELILVDDGAGGLTRLSGTSFAAPLVSGAASLIQDRWPWWRASPEETLAVLFQSAQDLGEEGVDGVYGWGLLDVEAAMSPLDFDALTYYFDSNGDGELELFASVDIAQAIVTPGVLDWAEAQEASLVGFETVCALFDVHCSERDFLIPLSTMLHGETGVVGGRTEYYQRHLQERLIDWAGGSDFTDVRSYEAPMSRDGWSASLSFGAARPDRDLDDGELPFQAGLTLRDERQGLAVRFGFGEGALMLSDRGAFGFYSDHDAATGGVNPILGFASGGAYAGGELAFGERTRLSFGVTERQDSQDIFDPISGAPITPIAGLPDYQAAAATVRLNHHISDRMSLNLALTELQESNSLLGAQGSGALGFGGGATTDAATFGFDAIVGATWALSGSATLAQTRSQDFDGVFGLEDDLTSTAFQLAAQKQKVFGERDGLRLSLAQPLNVESGALEISQVKVIDRSTGERGLVTERYSLAGQRDFVAEALYVAPAPFDLGQLSFFGQAATSQGSGATETAWGMRFTGAF